MLVHEILVLTVNSEIFARVLFSQNIAYAKIRENKILAKSLCRLLIYVNHALVANFSAARMSFNALLVNKILAKFRDLQYCLNAHPHSLPIAFHAGKCIRRFDGIYAYCRYFIDRKW